MLQEVLWKGARHLCSVPFWLRCSQTGRTGANGYTVRNAVERRAARFRKREESPDFAGQDAS